MLKCLGKKCQQNQEAGKDMVIFKILALALLLGQISGQYGNGDYMVTIDGGLDNVFRGRKPQRVSHTSGQSNL